ncbi:DUF488 domain-containing protein [Candidatus Enterococcus clewellii]|uniref:MarR family transcriptional regulator n=1 Tax=Candidatus Enterococcus clewellii TaxID=1834193 RepID=A0A242JXT4_9ENTE|nr:DUF488 domain-containing protein [Enterococcus sp. 9E7_DIV0242]OTP09741.1 hypothetical protein A5888_004129 [Enterococcus sp. 9E7_DIV0242]
MIYVKRAYEEPSEEDGYRVLVDRLWPRGISKEHAKIDSWLKEIAPSKELRQWFDHDPEKFDQFKEKYKEELAKDTGPMTQLLATIEKEKNVTLVYSAKNETMNNAVVLKAFIEKNE